MSRYEWEKGDIVIPSNQWAGFKKTLREAYNRALTQDLVLVAMALARVKADHKGKRNVDLRAALESELHAQDNVGGGRYGSAYGQARYPLQVLEPFHLVHKLVVVKEIVDGKGVKKLAVALVSLKKKDFPLATNKTDHFSADLGHITLKDKTREVCWRVEENNHACDSARDSFMGRTLFSALNKVVWGRQSGGYLVGNDEYSRDDEEPGGGGNQLKDCFGPLGEQEKERYYGRSVYAAARSARRGSARR